MKDGVVQITGGPDIRVKNPVVMSNASRFVAQAVHQVQDKTFLQTFSARDS